MGTNEFVKNVEVNDAVEVFANKDILKYGLSAAAVLGVIGGIVAIGKKKYDAYKADKEANAYLTVESEDEN